MPFWEQSKFKYRLESNKTNEIGNISRSLGTGTLVSRSLANQKKAKGGKITQNDFSFHFLLRKNIIERKFGNQVQSNQFHTDC